MSFTCILVIIYLFLLLTDISALILGIQCRITSMCREWALFVSITAFIVIGTTILAYFWIRCPM